MSVTVTVPPTLTEVVSRALWTAAQTGVAAVGAAGTGVVHVGTVKAAAVAGAAAGLSVLKTGGQAWVRGHRAAKAAADAAVYAAKLEAFAKAVDAEVAKRLAAAAPPAA